MSCVDCCYVLCFKQKTAYVMRISDWISDVCSSDLEMKVDGDVLVIGPGAVRAVIEPIAGPVGLPGLPCAAPIARRRDQPGIMAGDMKARDLPIGRAACRERVCQ